MAIEQIYDICRQKLNIHIDNFKGALYEFSGCCLSGDYYNECNKNDFLQMYNWTTSFITGLAPLLYCVEKNEKYLKWANTFSNQYYDKIFNHSMDTMHDLGFLYSPYSVSIYNITGDSFHKKIALKAADELAKRFDVKGHYIDAWNRMDSNDREGLAIIDCLMNVPLLFWAWKETGHTFYYDIATSHVDTVIKLFVREDYSVCHAYKFNRKTGEPLYEHNDCGFSVGSHWARGTAWAIYGLAIAARYTGKQEYLNIAAKIAEKYMSCLPNGQYVPVWDFRLPQDKPAKYCGKGNNATVWDEADVNNTCYNVDSSAAAIIACGLMEMNSQKENEEWMKFVDASLNTLCTDTFFDSDMSHAGMLKKQNGQMIYTMYGDYFFVEALQKRLYSFRTCW